MIKLKNPEEIEILREGGRRLAEILSILASKVVPGVSALELEEEARRLIKEGGDKPSFLGYRPQGAKRPFPAALCVSINDEIVHGIPNEAEKIVKEGDIVSLDFGLLHRGLITDAAITVPVGKVDEESKKLIEITRTALESGIETALPGSTIGDIGAAITRVVQESGFTLADSLVGQGVGYQVHEDPFVPNFGIAGRGEKLVPGLVIAIEPMVNIGKSGIKILSDGYTIKTRDGSRSAHFEHTVAITEKGNIILTS
ncbi:MAG: type I methionyl aminopeptidase [bacterium]|nr:type I methionyl aminopeptidase [bacterium]